MNELLADIPTEVVATCEAIVATSILVGGWFGIRKWFAKWKERLRQEGIDVATHAQQEESAVKRLARIEAKTDLIDALKIQLTEQDDRNRTMIHEAVALELTKLANDSADHWKATKINADDITKDRHAANDKFQQIMRMAESTNQKVDQLKGEINGKFKRGDERISTLERKAGG